MSQLIDGNQIQTMAAGMEEEFSGLLSDFVSQVVERVGAGEVSQSLFHQFKGASASLGLAEFSSESRKREEMCKNLQELPIDWEKGYLALLEESYQEAQAQLGR